MKIMFRKITAILVLTSIIISSIVVTPKAMAYVTTPDSVDINLEEFERYGSVREILTSAIDNSLFVAAFDYETGRVSFVGLDGEMIGYRYVADEEPFGHW